MSLPDVSAAPPGGGGADVPIRRAAHGRLDALRLGTTLDPTPLRAALVRLVAVAVVLSGAWYLWWRRLTVGGTGWFGWLFYVAEGLGYVTIAWTATLLTRTRRRLEGPPLPPSGTLDVFVTVCGEPVQMVEATVAAALGIAYPHRTYVLNDGRVAAKEGWVEIEHLAARLGVSCFTRTSGGRGKAANLNHALPLTGGEHIATIDADHVAHPTFADDTLGYLHDPNVAFVTTAQGFARRGRDVLNNGEPIFYHGLQPAKDVDGCAFSCGNATVYRRAALEDIGGFSEWNLVEDVHTSYLLHARGWDSAYHPHPVTTGVAPSTAAVYLTQRLRWAMDSLRLLFFDSPLVRPGLSWRRRMHYLHTTGFYLLASFQVVLLLAPPLHVLAGVRVLNDLAGEEYARNGMPFLVSIAAFLCISCGARSVIGTMQGSSFAWPVYVLAVVRTLTGVLPSSEPTVKAREPSFSLLLVPVVCCFLAQVAALALGVAGRAGGSGIALFWAGFQAFLLAGPVSALSRSTAVRDRANVAVRFVVVATAAVAVLASTAVPPGLMVDDLVVAGAARSDREVPGERVRLEPPAVGAYLGVMTDEPPEVDAGVVGVTAIVHWFQQWRSGEVRFRTDWLEATAASGAVPMITWEPWQRPEGSPSAPSQADARLDLLIDGTYDTFIRAWAEGAATYGGPLLLRPMHEMNAWWYPWSIGANGNTAEDYVAAWRHIHRIFSDAGASNVSWVWSVNELAGTRAHRDELSSSYPGDAYVDWVGMTGFNWGTSQGWSEWRSHDDIFRDTYDRLIAFGKPIIVPEIGSVDVGGDASRWVRTTLAGLERDYPMVKAAVWYDGRYSASADFRLTAGSAAPLRAAAEDAHWSTTPRTVPLRRS